jgi:phosphoribosylformylglycinamidine (FGAM) synthase-like enzyme
VSLYNETRGEGIYPTPVIGIVGIIDDITKSVPAGFQQTGDTIFILVAKSAGRAAERSVESLGSSEYAKVVLDAFWGEPPLLDLTDEAALHRCLAELADLRLLQSANDISDGGFAVALAESAFRKNVGAEIDLQGPAGFSIPDMIFREPTSHVVISVAPADVDALQKTVAKYEQLVAVPVGTTVKDKYEIRRKGEAVISTTVADLKHPWAQSLEQTLHDNTANEVYA